MRRTLAMAMLLSSATMAVANTLTWDSSGANPTAPVDGFGPWNTSTPLWSDGTQDVAWNNANADTPVFGNGGTAGTVTVNGITAAGLTFHPVSGTTPYTLNGGPITLAPGDNAISTPNSGAIPILFSPLAGSGQTRNVTFSGFVTLAAPANSYVGSSTVTRSRVLIGLSNADQAYTAPFGAAGNALTLDNSTLIGNGSTTGDIVSYQLPYDLTITGKNTIETGKNFTLGALGSTPYTVGGNGSLTFRSNVFNAVSRISASFSGTGPNAFTGTLHLEGPIIFYPANVGNFLGVPNGTLDNNATLRPYPGGPVTISFGALTGFGVLEGALVAASHVTWSVGSLGLSTTYYGSITDDTALTLTGGSLTLANPANKPHTYTGPTNVTGGTLVLAGSSLTSTSSISVANAATLRLKPGSTINTATLSLASGGTLDITSNSETFDTTVPGHDSPALVAAIASAYHDGAWDGTGITSSTAAADPAHSTALGYHVTGNQLLIQLASYGDANLDGKVDADDYALIDRSYDQSLTNAHWTDGDFNYDGTIDQNDYLLIDTSYAQAQGLSPEFLAMRESQFGATYVSNLLASVPEPALATWLVAASPFVLRRRMRG